MNIRFISDIHIEFAVIEIYRENSELADFNVDI